MPISRIFVVHQSYTRVGYTDHQEMVFRRHARAFEDAIAACARTTDYPAQAHFRWTSDASGSLRYWLAEASEESVQAWTELADAGRVEATCLPFHMSALPSEGAWLRHLGSIRTLRDRGFAVSSAMVVGPTGISAGIIDHLISSGIRSLMIAFDEGRGRTRLNRPSAFWWESRSGERLLTWLGAPVDLGRRLGIGGDVEHAQEQVAEYLTGLVDAGYPYDFAVLQVTGARPGPNSGPDASLSDFVRDWNRHANRSQPAMELAVPAAVASFLESEHGDSLPVRTGDWPDWAADGLASSAYETALSRAAYATASDAEGLALFGPRDGGPTDTARDDLAEALWHLGLYDEHTWGAEESVSEPDAFHSRAQWNTKAGFAYRGALLADVARDRFAEALCQQVAAEEDGLVVINPLPWTRDAYVHWPQDGVDTSLSLLDVTKGAPTPKWVTDHGVSFVADGVPALGYKVYRWTEGASFPESTLATDGTAIENQFYRVEIDQRTGLVRSWYDKALGRQLIDERSSYGVGQLIHERIDSAHDRAALYDPSPGGGTRTNAQLVRTSPALASIRIGRQSPLAASLVSEFRPHSGGRLTVEVTLYEHNRWVDVHVTLNKGRCIEPESSYLAFPFFVPGSVARVETAAGVVRVQDDLLEGTCRDWLATQGWIDFSNEAFGVTIATPDAPVSQLGRLNTGRWQTDFSPRSSTCFSWLVNNYWGTNFRPSQEGCLRFRYRLTSREGGFDAAAAWRFGREALHRPLVRQVSANPDGALPGTSHAHLTVEPSHVGISGLRDPSDGEGVLLHLREISGRDTVVRVGLAGYATAELVTPFEDVLGPAPMSGGAVIRHMRAHSAMTLKLSK